jgi:hypothetical protein
MSIFTVDMNEKDAVTCDVHRKGTGRRNINFSKALQNIRYLITYPY